MIATTIWPSKYWSRKTAKNPTYNAFYASKLQEYVEERLLFQNIPKYKNYPCWPSSPIFSHNTKLGYATFCWFCDTGSHIFCQIYFFSNIYFVQYIFVQYIFVEYIFLSNIFFLQYIFVEYIFCRIYFFSNIFLSNTFFVEYIFCQIYFWSNIFLVEYIFGRIYFLSNIFLVEYIFFQIYFLLNIFCQIFLLSNIYIFFNISFVKYFFLEYIFCQIYFSPNIFLVKYNFRGICFCWIKFCLVRFFLVGVEHKYLIPFWRAIHTRIHTQKGIRIQVHVFSGYTVTKIRRRV